MWLISTINSFRNCNCTYGCRTQTWPNHQSVKIYTCQHLLPWERACLNSTYSICLLLGHPASARKFHASKKMTMLELYYSLQKLPNSRPGIHHATFCQAPMFASDKQTLSVLRLHTVDNFYSKALILCAGTSRLVSGSDASSSFISSWLLPL